MPTPEEQKAEKIIEKLPSSPGIITKTGSALLATTLGAAAISQELYVVNEETVLLAGSAILFTYLVKAVSGPYSSWAAAKVENIKKVLDEARAEHTASVTERIDAVSQMKNVSATTTALFTLAKETAQLEAQAFEQKQKVEVTKQLKDVLDSWVRYEQSVREAEQSDLTKTVIGNVMKAIGETKTQKDILTEAVASVERLVKAKSI
ncbi:hypothetical protein CYLTODRAFT_400054 [Cylindrobasidium torrendii FP15055 ss-10]|uniref:ATP synthase subunit 4 n=1 Tax=Cylindrobasidium torrendii FP15055 ss-10 TaxID=1314674 RepID=A0A0D7B5D9_9AGAR|nr:hypothetical protein CYLTODRAFT_400054 [Cylindrobasidium torrendii FP15055 ss-10]